MADSHHTSYLPIISYRSRFRFSWDVLMLGLSLWTGFSVPFHSVFTSSSANSAWDEFALVSFLLTDFFFLLDLMLNFCTTFPDAMTGDEVRSHRRIMLLYIKSWRFLVDGLASIPWSFIDLLAPGDASSAAILRFVRLTRLSSLLTKIKAKETFKNTIRFLQIFLLFVLITHWTACIFRAVVSFSDNTWETTSAFRYHRNMYDDAPLQLYFYFVYYATLMVQTGGEMLPYTESQTIAVTISELANLILATLLYSDMLGVVDRFSERSSRVNARLDILHDMYRYLQIPSNLVTEIDQYAMKAESNYFDVEEQGKFLSDLPPSIYLEVSNFVLTDILNTNFYLRELDRNNIETLVRCLKSGISTPEEYFFKQSQKGESTFFLLRGKVNLLFLSAEDSEVFEHVKPGLHFGLCSILTVSKRYSYSACSVVYSSFARIQNEDLLSVIASNTLVFDEMKREERSRNDAFKGTIRAAVAQIPYLQGLVENEEGFFQLQTLFRAQTAFRGDVLIPKGVKNTRIYIVTLGSLELIYPRIDPVVLEVLSEGSIFGIYSVFSDLPQPFELRVQSESAQFLILENADLLLLASFIPTLKQAKLIYEKVKRDDFIKNIV